MVIWMVSLGGLSKSFLSLQSSRPFIFQPLVILQQGHHCLGLLPDVQSLVLIVLHELEILQSLYCENILLALLSDLDNIPAVRRVPPVIVPDLLTAGLYEILQQHQRLVDVPPVLAVVIQPLPYHLHDLREGDHVVGQVYKV